MTYKIQQFLSRPQVKSANQSVVLTRSSSSFSPDSQFFVIASDAGYVKVIKVEDLSTVAEKNGYFKDVTIFEEGGFIYLSAIQDSNHFITEKCSSSGGPFQPLSDYQIREPQGNDPVDIAAAGVTKNLATITTQIGFIAIFYRNTPGPFATIYPTTNNIVTAQNTSIADRNSIKLFSNPNELTNTLMLFNTGSGLISLISYLYDYSQELASIDCSTDVGSTGIQLPNGECQCLSYHYWDSPAKKCLPHCKNNLATAKDQNDLTKCLCHTGASWDQDIRQCTIDCSTTKYSTGQPEWPEVCECKFGSNWNPDILSCKLNCTTVRKAEGFDDFSNQCTCLAEYFWDSETLTCNKQCLETANQTGNVLEDDTCECKTGYQFDYYSSSCISLNCDVIPFAADLTSDKLNCNCQDSFVWEATLKLCIVDCENIVDSLGLGVNLNYYACQCQSGSTWEVSALSCVRDCTLIANSTGTNSNSEECECKVGFMWENALCINSCGLKVGEADTYNTAESRCNCLTGYYWSYESNACFRDCANEQKAIPVEGPDADSCYCYPGYAWDNQCTISCNGEFDVSVSSTVPNQCQCETNTYFIVSKNKCMVKCNEDPISTGQFSVDRCVCKANSQWNSQTNKCQCITGYTFNGSTKYCERSSTAAVTLGVVGGAIGSGSLIFIGLFMKQRSKRRKEDSEAVVEVRESVQEMAAKEEQI